MVIYIHQSKNGVDETVGSARVIEVDGELVVEFYLKPDFVLSDKARTEIEKELLKLAKKRFGDLSIG